MDDSTSKQTSEPREPDVASSWTRADWAVAAVLALVVAAVFANSLPNEFVYDDITVVVQDTRSHSLSRLGELFSGGYWQVTKRPLYRPLTHLSFALNHAVTGLWAPGYRVVNLLLHGTICLLVYRLGLRLLRTRFAAVAAAVLYAVHPLHVEAVVPIVGRSELLAALFVLLALLLHMQDAERRRAGVTWRYVVIVALTWASMLCKESAVVLIGLVVVYDLWRQWASGSPRDLRTWERFLISRFARRYAGMLLAVVVVLGMRQAAIGMLFGEGVTFPVADNPLPGEPLHGRLLTGLVLFGKYTRLLLVGYPLSCDYSYNAIPLPSTLTWPVVWGAACLTALLAVAVRSWRRGGVAALLILWFLVCYSPVANVLVLIGTLFADRLMYLPSAPLALLVGIVVDRALGGLGPAGSRLVRRLSAGGLVLIAGWIVTLGILTIARNPVWRSNETLFRDGLAKQPNAARCRYNIGAWLLRHGEPEEGIRHLERALEIVGQYYLARMQLAQAYAAQEEWDRVVAVLKPMFEDVDRPTEHLITPWLMYAKACEELGRAREAVDSYERVRKLDPKNVGALTGLARMVSDPNDRSLYDPPEAWLLVQEAANAHPEEPAALLQAARVGVMQRRWIEARAYYTRAYEILSEKAEAAKAGSLERAEKVRLRSMVRELNRLGEIFRARRDYRRGLLGAATRPTTTSDRRPASRPTMGSAPGAGNRD